MVSCAGLKDSIRIGDMMYGKSFRAARMTTDATGLDSTGQYVFTSMLKNERSNFGRGMLGASTFAKASLGVLAIKDPFFYIAAFATQPETWAWSIPVGIAWFGSRAVLGNAAKAMDRTTYIDMGTTFRDNGATYTSRQRAVRAIAESHLQARSAIGNEAQLFHHSGG